MNNIMLMDVLDLHDHCEADAAIPEILGDAFLFQNNFLYRNIRKAVLGLGFTFTQDDFCNYSVMPFASLPQILAQKKIPYFDNVSILKKLESENPQQFNYYGIPPVRRNYLLHESCHCLAETLLKKVNLNSVVKDPEQQKALKLVMGESLANTAEALAHALNPSDEQKLFYEINSYLVFDPKENQELMKAVKLIGYPSLFRLMYCSYLYSNCLFDSIKDKDFKKLVEFSITDKKLKINPAGLKVLRKVFNRSFQLNEDFRFGTTNFYFTLAGVQGDLFELLDLKLCEIICSSASIHAFLDSSEKYIF